MSKMNINDLPDEILLKIFSYLPLDTFLDILLVCQRWESVNNCLYSWRNHPVVYDGNKTDHEEFVRLVEKHNNKIGTILFRRIDYKRISSLLRNLPRLSRIDIVMCSIDEHMPLDLLMFPDIRILNIRNSYIIGRRESLQPFEIDFYNCPKLESLQLTDFGLSDYNFEGLLYCTKLREVQIEKIKDVSQDNMIKLLQLRRNQLQKLSIYGNGYTDDVIKYVSACKNLTHLKIIRCECFTDRSLHFLKSLQLQELTLWNNAIFSCTALIAMFESKNASRLSYVSFSKIKRLTMDVLNVIAVRCKELKSIGIYRCPCMEASIRSPEVVSLFNKQQVFFD